MNKILKYFFFSFLLIFMFCYGFIVHRNMIFPYKQIIYLKDAILNVPVIDYSNLEIKEYKIRNKYKNWNDFNYNRISVKKYISGMNIFSDRNYFNHINDEKLKGFMLIQLPRHHNIDIYMNALNDIIIYRVLCERNNNDKYKNWERVDYKLAIIGGLCIHTDVVRKKFKKGVVKILSGGSESVDPIFVDNLTLGESKFQIIQQTK